MNENTEKRETGSQNIRAGRVEGSISDTRVNDDHSQHDNSVNTVQTVNTVTQTDIRDAYKNTTIDKSRKTEKHINTTIDKSRKTENNIINSPGILIALIFAVVILVAMILFFVYRTNQLTIGSLAPRTTPAAVEHEVPSGEAAGAASSGQNPPAPGSNQTVSGQNVSGQPVPDQSGSGLPGQRPVPSQPVESTVPVAGLPEVAAIAVSSAVETPAPVVAAAGRSEPAAAAPPARKMNDNGVVMAVDTSSVPASINPRSKMLGIQGIFTEKGWAATRADDRDSRSDAGEAGRLSKKYGCRYVVTGRVAVRPGDNSASFVGGTSLQFAHCSGELIMVDTKTGDERPIFDASVKGAGNSFEQAGERAARDLFVDMDKALRNTL